MKLLSMTDFVISQWSIDLTLEQRERIYNYAKFLKQPLNLGMFVPCVDNEVLEEPVCFCELDCDNECSYNDAMYDYNKAKYRVLFEGFKVEWQWLIQNGNNYMNIKDFSSIEDMVNFGVELTLTESAIKQLGL